MISDSVFSFCLSFFRCFSLFHFSFPLDVKQDELVQAERLHVVVINHVDAEVEEFLAIALGRGDERTHVQFQLVEVVLVHDTVAIYQVLEE